MGYETKLYIGKSTNIKSGNESYFSVYAMVDLCKCGYDSNISQIDFKNTNKDFGWYFYGADGDTKITKDCYGDRPKPVPVNIVIDALRRDVKKDQYRRFKWALALLESMKDDEESIEVLLFGY